MVLHYFGYKVYYRTGSICKAEFGEALSVTLTVSNLSDSIYIKASDPLEFRFISFLKQIGSQRSLG